MALEAAMAQAWSSLLGKVVDSRARFLGDEFSVDVTNKQVTAIGRPVHVDDGLALLILHYLERRTEGLPAPTGTWLGISELSLAAGFADVFAARATGLLAAEFGRYPERIYAALEEVPGEHVPRADASLVLDALDGVPVLIDIWGADEEFEAGAGLLFDSSVTDVFCTEDILVLAETVAAGVVRCCTPRY
jgi:hypothetical protein